MKFLVPVSAHDADMLDGWVDVIIKFGGMANHSVAFLPTNPAAPHADAAVQRLTDANINAERLNVTLYPDGGWPKSTNVMFFEAIKQMRKQQQPWMWMELDCLPVRSNWADAIAGAYSSCGSMFMGCVVKTPWRVEATGKIVPSPDGDSDDMMCGCGIYPARMGELPDLQPLIDDFMKGPDSAPQGFDIYLRYGIKRYGRAHTSLIEDKWNTGNYRIENGSLVCDPLQSHEGIEPTQERIPFRIKTVPPTSATVHGCKDGSLHDLIMGGLDLSSPSQSTETVRRAGFQESFQPQDQPDNSRIDRLENEIGELKSLLVQAPSKNQPGGAGASPAEFAGSRSVKEHPESPGAEEKKPAPPSIVNRVVHLMSTGKKIRLDQASERLNIPINKLRAALKYDGSPVRIGALGWLSFAEEKAI